MTVTREQIWEALCQNVYEPDIDKQADAILALFAEQAAKCSEADIAAQVILGENTRLVARVAELEAALSKIAAMPHYKEPIPSPHISSLLKRYTLAVHIAEEMTSKHSEESHD